MKHKYTNTGLGTTDKHPPICAKFPPEMDKILRSLPNRSDFIREAVITKLRAEGLI